MIWAILVACHGADPETSGSPSLLVEAELAFESVEIGSDEPQVETLWVENVGNGRLFVQVPYFAEDGPFSVTSTSVTLERMEAYGYGVTFDPRTPFLHEGSLIIESNDPYGSSRSVAVSGEAFAPVLEVGTSPIDFGTTEVSCAAQEEIEVWNGGNAPLVVEPSLAGSSEIEIVSLSSFTIEPSTSAPIVLTYRPGDVAADTAVLTVESNDPVHPPVAVDVTGIGRAQETRTDVFEMRPTSDIVLVVDNSDSMDTEQTQLHDQIGTFVEGLDDAGVDYRIGVISTDSSEFDGPVMVPGDALDLLAEQIVVGTGGSGTSRTLEMLYDCVHVGSDCSPTEGFLRDDALFVGIIVSDQPDQSALNPDSYVHYLWAVKGDTDLVRIHAIAGAVPVPTCGTCSSAGFGYDEAVELTAGVFIDICADDWSETMRALADASHAGPPSSVGLSRNPVDHSIEVSVDGAPWAGRWTYTGRIVDGGTNEVVFADPLPAPSVLEVSYTVTAACE